MFYADVGNQLNLLIIVCFSLLNFVFAVTLGRANRSMLALGAAFFTPFVFSVASFLSPQETLAELYINIADIALLLILLLVLRAGLKHPPANSLFTLVCMLPPILLLAAGILRSRLYFMLAPFVNTSLAVSASTLGLYLLRKEKGYGSFLFWGMLCALAGAVIRAFPREGILICLYLVSKFSEYLLFFIYFCGETSKALTSKVAESEKMLSDLDRSINLEVKKRLWEIERSNKRLADMAKTDALSKALNKAAITAVIENLTTSRSAGVFSIFMFDIDDFKRLNDTQGHIEGDKCIRRIAFLAKSCIREVDSLGRYGGDEFIVVLPGVEIERAREIAERFRKKVEESGAPHLTVSIGVSAYPNDGSTTNDLIAAADKGLYVSKSKGKNSVSHKKLF